MQYATIDIYILMYISPYLVLVFVSLIGRGRKSFGLSTERFSFVKQCCGPRKAWGVLMDGVGVAVLIPSCAPRALAFGSLIEYILVCIFRGCSSRLVHALLTDAHHKQ